MTRLYGNYHTHTYRCGHATGLDEEYVKAAIATGFKELGFSDHISFKYLDFPGIRATRAQLNDYVDSINALKEKYKDQIIIHVGFEAEYIEDFINDYKDLLKHKGIEYLICGQHCRIKGNRQDWYNAYRHSKDSVNNYVDDVIKAMQSGLFTYIAHADHFMNGYREWDDYAIRQSRRLLAAAEEYNIPLEINCGGLRCAPSKHLVNSKGEPIECLYPYDKFWELASEYNVRVIVGMDAHSPSELTDNEDEEAIAIAEKYHLHLIDRVEIGKEALLK